MKAGWTTPRAIFFSFDRDGYNTHTVQEPKWKWTVRFLFDYLQIVESDRTYSDGMKHIAINKAYKKFDGINTLTITNEEVNNGSDDEAPN